MSRLRHTFDVEAITFLECLTDFLALEMIAQRVYIGVVTVKDNPPIQVNDRHTESFHLVALHIIVEQAAVGEAVFAECLHHLVIVHLQPRVEDVDLIVFFALILIHAEADGKEQEDATDAKEQIALKGFTFRLRPKMLTLGSVQACLALLSLNRIFQNSSHSPHVSLYVSHSVQFSCADE